jgi:hypothetical protein
MDTPTFSPRLHAVDLHAYINHLGNQAGIAQRRIEEALDELRSLTPDRLTGRGVAEIGADIAEMQGRLEVYERAAGVIRGHLEVDADPHYTVARLALNLIEMITWTDDQWSGRSNDVRRAKHDGRLEAARDIRLRLDIWIRHES